VSRELPGSFKGGERMGGLSSVEGSIAVVSGFDGSSSNKLALIASSLWLAHDTKTLQVWCFLEVP
jgi:hypothetical protein